MRAISDVISIIYGLRGLSIQLFSFLWEEDAHCPTPQIRNPRIMIINNVMIHPLFIRSPKFHNIISANSAIAPIINIVSMLSNVLSVNYFAKQKVTDFPIYSPLA